ncbi:MAG TPA: RNA methyltransferase substrate-binding domain-containing protein, partial [Thermoanaerobaculia bacterium]|nr:RNA methyltransferase substrate-binding domain-containing protein [Thermoanaerobaculia bacterium]
MKIASTSNPRIQAALRAVEGGERLLLEGARAIGEALAAGIVPREIFLEGDEGPPRDDAVRGAAERGAALCHVTSKVLSRLSDLPSTRGVVALAVPPRRALPDLRLPDDAPVLFLDGIHDPADGGGTP